MKVMKLKTIEKLTAGLVMLNMVILAIMCYNFYLKF